MFVSFATEHREKLGDVAPLLKRWREANEELASRLRFLEEVQTRPFLELRDVFVTFHERLHQSPPWELWEKREENGETPEAEFEPKTALGRKLWAARQRILESGQPLLDIDEVREEVARRRGEADNTG